MNRSTPGLPVHHQLLEFTQTHVHYSVMPSNHLILCCPLLLLPSIFPSIGVFSNESALCIRWPKYWRFSFSISPSNEYSGLISFRMDWLNLLAVQGTHSQESSPTPQCKSISAGYSMSVLIGAQENHLLWSQTGLGGNLALSLNSWGLGLVISSWTLSIVICKWGH